MNAMNRGPGRRCTGGSMENCSRNMGSYGSNMGNCGGNMGDCCDGMKNCGGNRENCCDGMKNCGKNRGNCGRNRGSVCDGMENRNGSCQRGNCGMSEEQMRQIMYECQNDPSNRCGDPTYGMPLGIGYVPWQQWGKRYDPAEGLACGTIFPELNLPFLGCIPKGWPNGRGGRA